MITHTHKQVDELLAEIDHLAKLYDPMKHVEYFRAIVIKRLGLTIMEDERILTIQKHTGCTRAQAQSLIDSGEF